RGRRGGPPGALRTSAQRAGCAVALQPAGALGGGYHQGAPCARGGDPEGRDGSGSQVAERTARGTATARRMDGGAAQCARTVIARVVLAEETGSQRLSQRRRRIARSWRGNGQDGGNRAPNPRGL